MIDIDHFKTINDRFGHAAGDDVLRKVGHALLNLSRKNEIIGRYGGEEFVCCLYGTEAPGAIAFAQRVHTAIKAIKVQGQAVTVSAGIAIRSPGSGLDLSAITRRADLALYEAKSSGRDSMMAYTETGFVRCP